MSEHVATSGMLHLNGNLLCAIDVETTGVDPRRAEIIQICVLPLNSQIKPLHHPRVKPFYMEMAPVNVANIDLESASVNKVELARVINEGMDSGRAADLLETWFDRLKSEGLLGENKRISPLAQNWVFDKWFVETWLGTAMFSYIFDGRYRDTMCAALYANDKADFMGEAYPYPKVNLGFIAQVLKIDNRTAHDAMSDCVTTAECYRRMLMGLT